MDNRRIESVLKLEKIVFDKIEFNRIGFRNDEDFNLEIQSSIAKKKDKDYRITLSLKGIKEKEYTIEIRISGFFSIDLAECVDEELKNTLVTKNTVAILMPYLRSQVSILTAQPDVECVVLPPFNINNMVDN